MRLQAMRWQPTTGSVRPQAILFANILWPAGYGLLARRRLGLKSAFDWREPVADPVVYQFFVGSAAGSRVIGLVQIGAYEAAGNRLIRLLLEEGEEYSETFLAIALARRMTSAAYYIADRLSR